MSDITPEKLEAFGHSLVGKGHGWQKKFADKLKIRSTQVSKMLLGLEPIGSKMQLRLYELGYADEEELIARDAIAHYSSQKIKTASEWLEREAIRSRNTEISEQIRLLCDIVKILEVKPKEELKRAKELLRAGGFQNSNH